MSVDDHGLEVLKKSGEEVTPGFRGDYYIKVGQLLNGSPISASNPLPVYIVSLETPLFFKAETTSDPGNEQELISVTVPASTVRRLMSVTIACRAESKFRVTADDVVVGSGRTGPAYPMATFSWGGGKIFSAGTVLKVHFLSRQGSAATDSEAYLHALDSNI